MESGTFTQINDRSGLLTTSLLKWPCRLIPEVKQLPHRDKDFLVEQVPVVHVRVGALLPLDGICAVPFLVQIAGVLPVLDGVPPWREGVVVLGRTDGHINDDLGLVAVGQLKTLVDSRDNVDVIDGATIHQSHVFEKRGREDDWDR